MLKTKVKVGKVTNLSDARYCAGMGVDLLGFPVGAGPDAIDPKKYKEITDWVSGPDFVIEWMDEQLPGDLVSLIQPYNADFIEIDVHQLGNFPELDTPLIVRLVSGDWEKSREALQKHSKRVSYVLLNQPVDGIDPSLLNEISHHFPVLIAADDTLDVDLLTRLPVAGISLEGEAELRPGFKDYTALSSILEKLELTEE